MLAAQAQQVEAEAFAASWLVLLIYCTELVFRVAKGRLEGAGWLAQM